MKRILFLVSTTEAGGAEVVFQNVMKYADRTKIEPFAVSLGLGQGDFPQQLIQMGVPVAVRPWRRLRNLGATLKTIRWLADFLRRNEIDGVISNGAHPHIYGSIAAWLAGKKALWYLMIIPRKPLWKNPVVEQIGLLLPSASYPAASEACRKALVALFPKREKTSQVVYHGYDPEMFKSLQPDPSFRQEFRLPQDASIVALPARLQRWKGQESFIRAIPLVLARFPNAHFLVVGGSLFGLEHDFKGFLERLAGDLGVGAHVHFTGHRQDVHRILAASDVFVHASIHPEPGANALIEAMAMGKAIVATNIGCVPELLGESEAGFLIPPEDPPAMAQAIGRFLADAALRRRLGEAAQRRAQERFSAPVMTRKIEDILEIFT